MSTNLACQFVEPAPGRWYYLLQNSHAPVGACDWREHATAYGPFPSQDAADAHLTDNHANPGGYSLVHYEPGFEPDQVLAELIADAEPPN